MGRRRRVSNRNAKVRVSFQKSSTSSGLRSSRTQSSVQAPACPARRPARLPQAAARPLVSLRLPLETPRRRDARPLPSVPRRFGPLATTKSHAQDNVNVKNAAKPLKPVPEREDARYSLMQVPEDPGFYVPTPPKATPPKAKKESEYAHVGSLDGSDVEHKRFPATSKRYGSYIVRAPPPSKRVSKCADGRCAIGTRQNGQRKPPRPQEECKRLAALGPVIEESLQRSLSQQKRLSHIMTPIKAQSRPKANSPPSASRQERALSRFTKELERYCVAASTNGRVPLPPSTPTVSESPTTLETVTEFLPYHKQFHAAGLAVTSREQMPRIPESAHPQVPAKHIGRTRAITVDRVQVDGSTASPSEQESTKRGPEASVVPDKPDSASAKSPPPPKTTRPQPPPRPTTRSLLPWFLKRNPSLPPNTHGERRFSKDHMHPSQATPAAPLLTPAGLIDSYFDDAQPLEPQDEHSPKRNLSVSPHVPSSVSSRTDKPLPKQPPPKRRSVPARSPRRHMDNTAEWPTAGVLIHDDTPPPPSQDHSADESDDEPPPAKKSSSLHSWTTIDDEIPNVPQMRSPLPPKETDDSMSTSVEGKPETPPKDEPVKESGPKERHHHHPGHSIYSKWYKATSRRRRSISKPLPVPTTIKEESETAPEEPERPLRTLPSPDDTVPRLRAEFPFRAGSSSSFERALDAVICKLDAMEERRRYERRMDLDAAHRAIIYPDTAEKAISKTASSKTSSASRPDHAASAEVPRPVPSSGVPSSDAAVEPADKDITDRDILVGLKMAICAACDEDLDAWICSKTGLRLRRFLADLKAFESVSQDRKVSPPTPISRRIRRSGRENRRIQAEPQSKKSTSKRWSQCFGADGQASLDEPSPKIHAVAAE